MTDTATPDDADPGPEPDDAPEVDDHATDHDHADDPGKRARAEAAAYRRRLRDAEGERDRLAEHLLGYQRRAAEELAAVSLSRGDDLWLATDDVSAVLDDAGQVDPGKVSTVVQQVLDGRPQLGRPAAGFDLGHRGGAPGSDPATFADVLRGDRRAGG